MAGHKPFSELRKDIDASPERLANVARERAEAEREEAVEVMARGVYESQRWSTGMLAALSWDRTVEMVRARMRDEMGRALDALLADGRWMLVHPDEMIRRDQLVSAGFQDVYPNGKLALSMTINKVVETQPELFRVSPAVEKENDQ